MLKSFIGALKVSYGELEFGLDIEPEKGTADSGDLEVDLPNLFVAVAEAAKERQAAVAILIDEIQYFSSSELSALIMAMHRMQQRQLPLALMGCASICRRAIKRNRNTPPSIQPIDSLSA